MKRTNLWMCLILSLLLCVFMSCDSPELPEVPGETTVVTEEAETPYTILHTVTDITENLPVYLGTENQSYLLKRGTVSPFNSYLQDGVLYIYSQMDDAGALSPRIIPFSLSGEPDDANIITVPVPSDIAPIYAQRLSSGEFCILYNRELPSEDKRNPETEPYAAMLSADGTLLCEYMLLNDFDTASYAATWIGNYGYLISEAEDGTPVMLFSQGLTHVSYRYDRTANAIVRTGYAADTEYRTHFLRQYLGDTTFRFCGTVGNRDVTTVLDTATGTFTQADDFGLPPTDYGYWTIYGDDGTCYLYDEISVYRIGETGRLQKLVDLMDCGLEIDPYADVLIAADDHNFLLAKSRDGRVFYRIVTEFSTEPDDRTVLKLDYIGNTSSNFTWLRGIVREFEAANPEYKIALRQKTLPSYSSLEERMKVLEDALLFDAHPDMMFLDIDGMNNAALAHLYEKQIFADLGPVCGDRLLGCVRETMTYRDRLYMLPTRMRFSTFLCLPETCDGYLTWDAFYDVIDGLYEHEVLTSNEYVKDTLYNNGIMDFFDRENRTAAYDTPAFYDMIHYVTTLDDVIDPTVGNMRSHAVGESAYQNPAFPACISAGGIKFVETSVDYAGHLVAVKLLFGENEVNWCGYPSQRGGGASFSFYGHLAVLSDSEQKEICASFLSEMLTDRAQMQGDRSGLPVTEQALRAQLDAVRYSYYKTEDYERIGDPNAEVPGADGFMMIDGKEIPLGGNEIPLSPEASYPAAVDIEQHFGTYTPYTEVVLEDAEIEAFMRFLNNCQMKAGTDDTVLQIVTEELSYWENGVTPIEEAAKKIQSRVQIYLSE